MEASVILGSSVIGAIVGAAATLFTKSKENKLKHITEERKNWRDQIRKLSEELTEVLNIKNEVEFQNSIRQIHTKFAVRLNPLDEADQRILSDIISLKQNDERNHQQIITNVSYLLKHDWDRAKAEVSSKQRILFGVILGITLILWNYCFCWAISDETCPVWYGEMHELVKWIFTITTSVLLLKKIALFLDNYPRYSKKWFCKLFHTFFSELFEIPKRKVQ